MDSHLHSHRLSKADSCTSVHSPSNYRMGTVGRTRFYDLTQRVYGSKNSCRNVHQISQGNSKDNSTPASQPGYGKYRTRAKVFSKYPLLGTARITPQLRPDQAIGNAELVQKCSIKHSRQKTVNIVLFKAREERDRRTGKGRIVGAMITVDTTPSSSRTGSSFPRPAHYSCRYPTL